MKLEIDPYDHGEVVEETDDPIKENSYALLNGEATLSSAQKCEVKEYEARYNLKGEQKLKSIKKKDKKDGGEDSDDEDGEDKDSQFAMRSEKWFARDGEMYSQTLTIHSVHIQRAMREVIREYPGVNLRANPIILTGTLKCVFHYRRELARYRDQVQDPAAKLHVALLLRFMERELRRDIRSYNANVESSPLQPTTDFSNLWMLFKPGDPVVTGRNESQRVLRMHSSYYTCGAQRSWWIVTRALDHDGETFGEVEPEFRIRSFEGARLVSKLSIYPLKYDRNAESVRQTFIAQGQKFCSLVGCHYRSYNGIAKALGHKRDSGQNGQYDEFPLETTMINGRIMVDCRMFAVFKAPNRVVLEERKDHDCDISGGMQAFSDDEYLIFNNTVPGFSLNEKKWCFFSVKLIEPVDLNVNAFDYLLLPAEQKQLVYALVRTHSQNNGGFDDMIKGKGKGLIFVLHGAPGVGKTFTAESVADHLHRPLYILHSGDLGVTPDSVEKGLSDALMLATTWKAVLLIDEADVFLEQRSVQDLTRNCLVSLFLRILEYYQGILFLTTNRIVTFDLAFKSRVHLALKYNELDATQRRELWKLFISRAPSAANKTWSGKELEELAAVHLNGRQIKNAVRTANSLASAANGDLEQEHLRTVLKTLESFEKDLNEETQDPTCFTPKMIRRQSTLLSRLSLTDAPLMEEPEPMK